MSTPEFVHPVPAEDVRSFLSTLLTTFLHSPYADDADKRIAQRQRDWRPERAWGHRDRGRYVATLGTDERALTVPGPAGGTRDLTADALTAVTVSATHRRQGLLSAMLGASLTAARDRGDAVSVLVAAEWPIYGRFGYSLAADSAEYTYHSRRPGAALPPPPAGSVHPVEPEDLREAAPAVFDAARRLRAGHVDRRDPWWPRRLGIDGYDVFGPQPTWYLHEGPNGPDGVVAWRPVRDFTLTGELGAIQVEEFFAANDTAYEHLWGYLSGIDVVEEIRLPDRPVDEAIRWRMTDARALSLRHRYDQLWLRLLDVPAALAARSYSVPGHLVLDVVDADFGGFAAGRFVLDAGEVDATCAPTTEAPDLCVSQRALASAYLGGFPLRARVAGGEVAELVPGAIARADAMFSTPLAPWCQTGF